MFNVVALVGSVESVVGWFSSRAERMVRLAAARRTLFALVVGILILVWYFIIENNNSRSNRE